MSPPELLADSPPLPRVRIPPLHCPIPFAVNPHADELNKGGLDWISRFGLFPDQAGWDRYAGSELGFLPAHVMPRARRGPALQTAANLYFWLWAFDDLVCDEATGGRSAGDQVLLLCDLVRATEIPGIPADGSLPGGPFAAALHDLRRQIDRVATPVQSARWVAAMHPYLLANAAAAVRDERGAVPTLDTYVAQRVHSGAMKPTLMLLDVAECYELPPYVMERPEVQALNEMVCTIVGWDNDLLTYWKECTRGGAAHNLVTVLAQQRGCSPAEAIDEAVAMRDRVLRLFLHLRERVGADADPRLRDYLAGLSSWIRGHLDWGMATARYRNPEDPADLPQDFAHDFRDALLEPLPIPSIAWWWRQLRP